MAARLTDWRVTMTEDLVERMVGHRTRLAQEDSNRWHDGEDQALDRHLDLSVMLDASAVSLGALVPRGWLVLGLCGFGPAFVSGAPPAVLAVGLGGILLADRALRRFSSGLQYIVGAVLAWTAVAPLFHAAARPKVHGLPAFALDGSAAASAGDVRPVLAAHDLVFRYRDRGDPVLRGCSLDVSAGDRILLQGPSGGGKSTLASLLTGLRTPESGLLFLDGLDRQTLGTESWRRRVVACPQFHENHVFLGTVGFNLLMGQDWPPAPADLQRAEAVCRDLGLDDLLKKMPAGLLQLVGETGWQLSHGERSRLYIARALLQNPELLVLDESFAQLDPESLERAMRCVLERARTVMVIAHP